MMCVREKDEKSSVFLGAILALVAMASAVASLSSPLAMGAYGLRCVCGYGCVHVHVWRGNFSGLQKHIIS